MTRGDYTFSLPEYRFIQQRYQWRNRDTAEVDPQSDAFPQFMSDLSLSMLDIDRASASAFAPYSITLLVDFLERSHVYYMQKAIPELGYALHQALKDVPAGHPISRFGPLLFQKFADSCLAHFVYEENKLFPYALELERAVAMESRRPGAYSASRFIQEHPLSELDSGKLASLFEMLGSGLESNFGLAHFHAKLRWLESDMKLHGLIEEDVLVPKLLTLEQKLH